MSDLISIITCTGHRPETLNLCKYFIERQTYKGSIQWVVVHDQKDPLLLESKKSNISVELHKGPRVWDENYNTHRGNMETALAAVKGDYVFIVEDDDYYKANYIDYMLKVIKVADVKAAGIAAARYYHVGIPGYKVMFNLKHASLSQTVLHKSLLPELNKATSSGELYFDIEFWNLLHKNNHHNLLIEHTPISVGMKGMPGRLGITPSHKEARDYMYDSGLVKLKEWLGEDDSLLYFNYIKTIKEKVYATNSQR